MNAEPVPNPALNPARQLVPTERAVHKRFPHIPDLSAILPRGHAPVAGVQYLHILRENVPWAEQQGAARYHGVPIYYIGPHACELLYMGAAVGTADAAFTPEVLAEPILLDLHAAYFEANRPAAEPTPARPAGPNATAMAAPNAPKEPSPPVAPRKPIPHKPRP